MKTLKDLTSADWKHIRGTVKRQFEEYAPEDSETPEEEVMTSIGYLTVGLSDPEDEDSGWVSGFGETWGRDAWPPVAMTAKHEPDEGEWTDCDAELVTLLTQVYNYLTSGVVESLEETFIGSDFTYFTGAVLKSGSCTWPESRHFIRLLRAMPNNERAFRYITIELEDGC